MNLEDGASYQQIPEVDPEVEKDSDILRIEKCQKKGIWSIIHSGDIEYLKELLKTDPQKCYDRGPVGELPLHLCFLYNSGKQLEMAWLILSVFPELLTARYIEGPAGSLYDNENILHIAITVRNEEVVQRILTMGQGRDTARLLKQETTGTFFDYGKPCYYGGFPLFFAAATNQLGIFKLLLSHGADFNDRDRFGNTVLHLLVIHNLKSVYAAVSKLWKEAFEGNSADKKLWLIQNNEGLTPLSLAAKLGLYDMTSALIEEYTHVQWSYGAVSCVIIPRDQLDNAIEELVKASHVKLFDISKIEKVIDLKWNTFAEEETWKKLRIVVLYMVVFFIFIITRNRYKSTYHSSWLEFVLYYGLLFLVLRGAIYKFTEEIFEIRDVGWANYAAATGAAYFENVLSCTFGLSTFLFLVFSVMQSGLMDELFLGIASFTLGLYLFVLLLYCSKLSFILVSALIRMLSTDMLYFGTVYIGVIALFSQAIYIFEDTPNAGFAGFLHILHANFATTLGEYSFDEGSELSNALLISSLYSVFCVVSSVAMVNVLIAMFSYTYTDIYSASRVYWNMQRATIEIEMEYKLGYEEMANFRRRCSMEIDGESYYQFEDVNNDVYKDTSTPAYDENASKLKEVEKKIDLLTMSLNQKIDAVLELVDSRLPVM